MICFLLLVVTQQQTISQKYWYEEAQSSGLKLIEYGLNVDLRGHSINKKTGYIKLFKK